MGEMRNAYKYFRWKTRKRSPTGRQWGRWYDTKMKLKKFGVSITLDYLAETRVQ
jgi:hypothetical protein